MINLVKIFVKLSILVLCHTALAVPTQPEYNVENSDLVKNLFENFIVKYKRSYSVGEKIQRLQYFKQSLVEINRLNKGNPAAVFDISKFSDWSPEEQKILSGFKNSLQGGDSSCGDIKNVTTHDAPDAFDWKDKNAVTPAKSQELCGSCWAFSATGAVESAYAIKHNKQLSLSEQQLMDCDKKSHGCGGGLMNTAISELIEQGGQELESDYPYQAKNSKTCNFDKTKIAAKVTACNIYHQLNDDQIKETLFKAGPLAIGIGADPLGTYTGGIITDCSFVSLNHGVLLVGYGSENGTDFWNVKNSWGADWGEHGFFRMKRGSSCLGLGEYIVSAVVE